MQAFTRKKLDSYIDQVAKLNGVSSATRTFTVAPSVAQKLEELMQDSSAFLAQINIVPVTEQIGQTIGMGVSGPIASRTDTNTAERQTRDMTTLTPFDYVCVKTNFDTHIPYAQLDAWAKFPDFQTRIRDTIVKRMALDRIMIGWNGIKASANTDLAKYPLLQDVNKGWLQLLREYQGGAQFLTEAKASSGVIKIGKSVSDEEGYKNLDALVMHMVNSLIAPWMRDDPSLVVIMSRSLLADKYFPLVNQGQRNEDILAADVIISQKRVGGLQAVTVPYFPEGTIMVTSLKNLSIYVQEGARRRYMLERPQRDRMENYESSNEGMVIEDYTIACAAENIKIMSDDTTAATTTTGA